MLINFSKMKLNKNKFRKGIFFVVYHLEDRNPKFLIQKRKLHWKGYEFPKGGVEKGETELQALKREMSEEVGLKIKKIYNHKIKGKWIYEKNLKDRPGIIGQTYSLYSVEVEKGNPQIDKREHYSSEWLCATKSLKKLTHKNQKKSLKLVREWLKLKQ